MVATEIIVSAAAAYIAKKGANILTELGEKEKDIFLGNAKDIAQLKLQLLSAETKDEEKRVTKELEYAYRTLERLYDSSRITVINELTGNDAIGEILNGIIDGKKAKEFY